MGQSTAHDLGLLVDLLRHEMAVVALVDRVSGGEAFLLGPRDASVRLIVELRRRPGQHDPITIVEIRHLVGEGSERQRIGAEVHFAVAVAHRQRRAAPRADQEVGLAGEEKRQREGAMQLRQRCRDGLDRRAASLQFGGDEMRHDLGIGFGREAMALGGERLPQFTEVFDDAVVHDRHALARMRMRVRLVRLAMGGPARMPDADGALEGMVR